LNKPKKPSLSKVSSDTAHNTRKGHRLGLESAAVVRNREEIGKSNPNIVTLTGVKNMDDQMS